jgi:hypothetical protein
MTKARIGQQSLDLKDAGQVKTEENDDHSGDAGEQRFVLRKDLAHFRRDRAQRDEDDAKADDECAGIEHHLAEEFAFFQLQLLDADAGDQGNVSGHERKHAGRQERDQSGDKGGERQWQTRHISLLCSLL